MFWFWKKDTALRKAITFYYSKIDVVQGINNWGCLCWAYAVYLKLKQRGYDVSDIRLVQLWKIDDNINNNKQFLKGNNKTATSDSHFWLSIGRFSTIFDSEWILLKGYKYKLFIKSKDIKKFTASALKEGGWNDCFNRRRGVKEINSILKIKMGIHL